MESFEVRQSVRKFIESCPPNVDWLVPYDKYVIPFMTLDGSPIPDMDIRLLKEEHIFCPCLVFEAKTNKMAMRQQFYIRLHRMKRHYKTSTHKKWYDYIMERIESGEQLDPYSLVARFCNAKLPSPPGWVPPRIPIFRLFGAPTAKSMLERQRELLGIQTQGEPVNEPVEPQRSKSSLNEDPINFDTDDEEESDDEGQTLAYDITQLFPELKKKVRKFKNLSVNVGRETHHVTQLIQTIFELIQELMWKHDWNSASTLFTTTFGKVHLYPDIIFNIGLALTQAVPELRDGQTRNFFNHIIAVLAPHQTQHMRLESIYRLFASGRDQDAKDAIEDNIRIAEIRHNHLYHGYLGIACLAQWLKAQNHSVSSWLQSKHDGTSESHRHIHDKNLSMSIYSFEQALLRNPSCDYWVYFLVLLYLETGQTSEALKLTETFVSDFPDHPSGWKTHAKLLRYLNTELDSKPRHLNDEMAAWSQLLRLDASSEEGFLAMLQFYHEGLVSCCDMLIIIINRMDIVSREAEESKMWNLFLSIAMVRKLALSQGNIIRSGNYHSQRAFYTRLHSWRHRFWSEDAFNHQKIDFDRNCLIFSCLSCLMTIGPCPYTFHVVKSMIDDPNYYEFVHYAKKYNCAELLQKQENFVKIEQKRKETLKGNDSGVNQGKETKEKIQMVYKKWFQPDENDKEAQEEDENEEKILKTIDDFGVEPGHPIYQQSLYDQNELVDGNDRYAQESEDEFNFEKIEKNEDSSSQSSSRSKDSIYHQNDDSKSSISLMSSSSRRSSISKSSNKKSPLTSDDERIIASNNNNSNRSSKRSSFEKQNEYQLVNEDENEENQNLIENEENSSQASEQKSNSQHEEEEDDEEENDEYEPPKKKKKIRDDSSFQSENDQVLSSLPPFYEGDFKEVEKKVEEKVEGQSKDQSEDQAENSSENAIELDSSHESSSQNASSSSSQSSSSNSNRGSSSSSSKEDIDIDAFLAAMDSEFGQQ